MTTATERRTRRIGRWLPILVASSALVALSVHPAQATVIDDWASVKVPPPPTVQSVTVDPATTALLLLDFVKQTCSGPRCIAVVPAVTSMLQAARAHHVMVVYSITLASTLADIVPPLAPLPGDPSVQGTPDKFLNTDLQQILTSHGIRTVIVAGVAANGAVLYTASHAAQTGFDVIVPVDAAPAETPYAEQLTAWNLANAPRISARVKLTTTELIQF
ncbi:MAG: isochorismatase family protein [Vulcanimicrobiaceae bacterium]|jgi:nicotinamidase-related amidase